MAKFEHNEIISETGVILKLRKLNQKLNDDVESQVGGMFRMNAGGAIGYLFSVHTNNKEIARGMYCHRISEINLNEWDYIVDIESGLIYKLYKAPQADLNFIAQLKKLNRYTGR